MQQVDRFFNVPFLTAEEVELWSYKIDTEGLEAEISVSAIPLYCYTSPEYTFSYAQADGKLTLTMEAHEGAPHDLELRDLHLPVYTVDNDRQALLLLKVACDRLCRVLNAATGLVLVAMEMDYQIGQLALEIPYDLEGYLLESH